MKYEKPAIEIMKFEEQDVITLSLSESDDEIEYPTNKTTATYSF